MKISLDVCFVSFGLYIVAAVVVDARGTASDLDALLISKRGLYRAFGKLDLGICA